VALNPTEITVTVGAPPTPVPSIVSSAAP